MIELIGIEHLHIDCGFSVLDNYAILIGGDS